MNLLDEVTKLKPVIGTRVKSRMKELSFNPDWFSELCFCILTSNSKARTALAIQQQLGGKGFLTLSQDELVLAIKRNKHRFHNVKARYIIEARKHADVKRVISSMDALERRRWLVANVKGCGYKEASHFLRNVGYNDYAILDRHVIRLMYEAKMIPKMPKSMNGRVYEQLESKLSKLASALGMSQGELDFYLWYMKAGDVLK